MGSARRYIPPPIEGIQTELRIPEVAGEEVHLIAPVRLGRGYRLGMAYSVTDLRILRSYTDPAHSRRPQRRLQARTPAPHLAAVAGGDA
jgi:hypothetical protein